MKSEDGGLFTWQPRARVTESKPLARLLVPRPVLCGRGAVGVLRFVILARLLCLAREESRFLALALFMYAMMVAVSASAQMTGADWCQSPNVPKESAVISVTGVGEHQIVLPEPGEPIQVCGYSYDLGGTTPAAEFDYGTKTTTDCDTGPTPLTGAMSAATRDVVASLNLFTAPGGNQLCLKLGGTSPTAVGVVTFAQKTP